MKENHFFSTSVTKEENLTINILKSHNRSYRLLGGFLLIHVKGVGKWWESETLRPEELIH